MRTKLEISALVLGLLVCGLLIGLVILWDQPDNPRCNLQDLILKDELMPPGWQRQWYVLPPALPEQGAQDALAVQFEQDNTRLAHHTVYRYRNQIEAIVWLRVNRELYFPSSWHWSALGAPRQWTLAANEMSIECGDSDYESLGDRCVAVMRYGPLISDFSSPVGAEGMSIEEFRKIVGAMDSSFSACLR